MERSIHRFLNRLLSAQAMKMISSLIEHISLQYLISPNVHFPFRLFLFEQWSSMPPSNVVEVSPSHRSRFALICPIENTLAQLIIAKNTNIDLIKKYEEKKLEEHRYVQLPSPALSPVDFPSDVNRRSSTNVRKCRTIFSNEWTN